MTEDSAWIKAERDHEFRMLREQNEDRKLQRRAVTERITHITVGVTIVLVVAIVVTLIWRVTVNWSAADTERDRICAETGGTRAAINGGGVVCIHLGEIEPG